MGSADTDGLDEALFGSLEPNGGEDEEFGDGDGILNPIEEIEKERLQNRANTVEAVLSQTDTTGLPAFFQNVLPSKETTPAPSTAKSNPSASKSTSKPAESASSSANAQSGSPPTPSSLVSTSTAPSTSPRVSQPSNLPSSGAFLPVSILSHDHR